jgi:hypothetical protein
MSFPQEWTIQSQCQDCVHKAHTKHTQTQRNTESQSDEQHGSHQNSLVNPGARDNLDIVTGLSILEENS